MTVVGPGGIGKTRLALRYATTRRWRYDGVWFCDMREARTPDDMAYVALRAFAGGRAVPAIDADTALLRVLASRPRALVILDNLEHLMPGAALMVRRFVAAAPEARFIVTSRVPLEIAGERVVEIGGVDGGDAVELFVERVRSRMEFAPGDDELVSIAEIVRRLGGVPLAIELAAARVGAEDPRALLARVSLANMTEDALTCAFDLLPPAERDVLRRCSVFHGSFSLQAAAAIAGVRSESDIIALAEKNLLRVDRYQPMRLSMCEGIRSFAAASMSPEESVIIAERHTRFFRDRARIIADSNSETRPGDAGDDWEDLHAAMLFASIDHPDIVLNIALAIDVLAFGNGLGAGELALLDDALRRGAACDLGLLGRALLVRSGALYAVGRLVEARRDAETALSLAGEIDDPRRAGAARRAAAQAAFQLGEFDLARSHLTASLAIERELGDAVAIAAVHRQIGSLHNSLGELDAARAAFERSLKLSHGSGDDAGEALARMGLAWQFFEVGDRDEATNQYDRALVIVRRLKMTRSERIITGYMGLVHFDAGDLALADDHLRRASLASRRAGDLRVEGIFEGVRGGVLAAQDHIDEARAAFDLADALLARNTFYQGAIRVHRGHLDLAEARAATAKGLFAIAEASIASARWRVEEASALARRSDDARMAVRILERALG